jgi:hypothetical protein
MESFAQQVFNLSNIVQSNQDLNHNSNKSNTAFVLVLGNTSYLAKAAKQLEIG